MLPGKTYPYHGLHYRNMADNNDLDEHCVTVKKEFNLKTDKCEDDVFFFSTTGALYWNDFSFCLKGSSNSVVLGTSCPSFMVSETEWLSEEARKKDFIFKSTSSNKYFKRSSDKKKLELGASPEKGWAFHDADTSSNCKYYISYKFPFFILS